MANVEIWKDIPECQGYQASDKGRIRSLDRVIVPRNGQGKHWRTRRCKGKVLSTHLQPNGYVGLSLGSKTHFLAHQLIALAFLGPCPEGMEVCHNNGKRSDNRIENLRYDTRPGNHADCKRHGTYRNGERSYRAKLTWDQIRKIRGSELSQLQLAKIYGVDRHTINCIINRKTWRVEDTQ